MTYLAHDLFTDEPPRRRLMPPPDPRPSPPRLPVVPADPAGQKTPPTAAAAAATESSAADHGQSSSADRGKSPTSDHKQTNGDSAVAAVEELVSSTDVDIMNITNEQQLITYLLEKVSLKPTYEVNLKLTC